MNTLSREEVEEFRIFFNAAHHRGEISEKSLRKSEALCDMALRACDAPEVAKDAERYRWLRRSELISFHHKKLWFEGVSNLDAAIDAAMQAGRKQ